MLKILLVMLASFLMIPNTTMTASKKRKKTRHVTFDANTKEFFDYKTTGLNAFDGMRFSAIQKNMCLDDGGSTHDFFHVAIPYKIKDEKIQFGCFKLPDPTKTKSRFIRIDTKDRLKEMVDFHDTVGTSRIYLSSIYENFFGMIFEEVTHQLGGWGKKLSRYKQYSRWFPHGVREGIIAHAGATIFIYFLDFTMTPLSTTAEKQFSFFDFDNAPSEMSWITSKLFEDEEAAVGFLSK